METDAFVCYLDFFCFERRSIFDPLFMDEIYRIMNYTIIAESEKLN
jgi:hypothetical protein